jgi:nucleotide-binding universal stress UspA family protein
MKTKILLAVDQSKSAMNAVRYVANLFKNQPDVSITLLHVFLPYLHGTPLEPAHPESEEEYGITKKFWEEAQHASGEKCLVQARKILTGTGLSDHQIQTKSIEPLPAISDVAHEILKESEKGGYGTIVLGKRGLSAIEHFMIGSVTEKIVRHAKGHTVWVIE